MTAVPGKTAYQVAQEGFAEATGRRDPSGAHAPWWLDRTDFAPAPVPPSATPNPEPERRTCAACGAVEPGRWTLALRPSRMFKIWKGASSEVDLCSWACETAYRRAERAERTVHWPAVLPGDLRIHADEHGYPAAQAAVFLARGGHAPGEMCSLIDYSPPAHEMECEAHLGRDCICPPLSPGDPRRDR